MPADEADLAEIAVLAARWEHAAGALTRAAEQWRSRAGPPEVTAFAERAAATLAGHAEVASAAAERLRDYCTAVRSADDDGARSVRCAIQAADNMSTTPIADVTETPASKA